MLEIKGRSMMERMIVSKLREIEQNENIRILIAVESGSRAWGFASPDSDYDVRFIYFRKREDYLRLDTMRDVIELPVDEVLDINGWDLQKALRLLYKSNPTLFEWFSSPIVYMETDFADTFRPIMKDYFSSKRSLYHYVSMAEGNYREYLRGEMVRAKKYFYVLRPILACRWIIEKQTPPPVLFSELVETELPKGLVPDVEKLLELKMKSPEIRMMQRVERLNAYLDESIAEVKRIVQSMEDTKNPGWQELNEFFLKVIGNQPNA
jgi:hypothetical protein